LSAPFGTNFEEQAHLRDLCRDAVRSRLASGDVIVIDHLAARKGTEVEKPSGRAAPWMLFLPPYSPDLNQIEMAFAKFRPQRRKKAVRTIDASGRPSATSAPCSRQPANRVPKLLQCRRLCVKLVAQCSSDSICSRPAK
jgi:transposase